MAGQLANSVHLENFVCVCLHVAWPGVPPDSNKGQHSLDLSVCVCLRVAWPGVLVRI